MAAMTGEEYQHGVTLFVSDHVETMEEAVAERLMQVCDSEVPELTMDWRWTERCRSMIYTRTCCWDHLGVIPGSKTPWGVGGGIISGMLIRSALCGTEMWTHKQGSSLWYWLAGFSGMDTDQATCLWWHGVEHTAGRPRPTCFLQASRHMASEGN